jgi:hypothetical protein
MEEEDDDRSVLGWRIEEGSSVVTWMGGRGGARLYGRRRAVTRRL